MKKSKTQKRIARHARVRSKVFGTSQRPRVSVFRSNRNLFVQLIDDQNGKTILSSKISATQKGKSKISKTEKSKQLGQNLAQEIKAKGINEVVFDRGGFKFHGRIKALAESLKEGGIKI
jgi:large subunit ribosomal protein L18